MSFLGKLFGQKPARLPVEPHVRGDGLRQVQIVGESHRQDALARLAGPRTKEGVSVWVLAALVPEPTNSHDPKAVMVKIEGHHVGYLSREMAPVYLALEPAGRQSIKAEIKGGWLRRNAGEDDGSFGVMLCLPTAIGKALNEAQFHHE